MDHVLEFTGRGIFVLCGMVSILMGAIMTYGGACLIRWSLER